MFKTATVIYINIIYVYILYVHLHTGFIIKVIAHFLGKIYLLIVSVKILKIRQNPRPRHQYTCGNVFTIPERHLEPLDDNDI